METKEKIFDFSKDKCTIPYNVVIPNDSTSQILTNDVEETKLSNQEDEVENKIYKQDSPETAVSSYVDPEAFKSGSVKMYADDRGPKFYPVKGNNITAPIITKNLPEAFNYLPIYGQPKENESLEDFQNNKIREYVGCGLSDEDFEKLSRYCSPNHLKTGKELVMLSRTPAFGIQLEHDEMEESSGDGDGLNILRRFKLRVQKDKANLYVKKLKYRGMRLLPLTKQNTIDKEDPNDTAVEPGKDLLFRVRIYRPFNYGKEKIRSRHSIFSCDVLLLGRSLLTTLRERIVCANDIDVRVDVSENLDKIEPSLTIARDMFPSGFFFINNMFYVDMRAGCIDYSKPIRDWAQKRSMGEFPTRCLSAVRLDELVIRLGHPEVYMHQGNCEHLFTFSEVRLVGASDPLRASLYPRHTAVLQHQTVYCTTCAEFAAKWIVVGCERVPFDPAFFCETCFRLYLYVDGRKVGNFRAYSYRGNEINMLKPPG